MKYIKVYESPNPELLQKIVVCLLEDGIKTARITSHDQSAIEVVMKEKTSAEENIKEYLLIMEDALHPDSENNVHLITDKGDLLKFIPIMFFYFVGGFIFVFSKIEQGEWAWLILFFAPLFILRFFAQKIGALIIPFPLFVDDEVWILKMKRITKNLTWFFWVFALPMVYLFFRENGFSWGEIISGNGVYTRSILTFLSPIIFIGSVLYLYKVIFHFRKYLDPKYYSAEEIEKIKEQKHKAIEEAQKI